MPSATEDLIDEAPSSINPYEVLELEKTATPEEVKTAYRKKALRHHPDKANAESKEEAHRKFQEIAFAYAILSDDRRRKRYDITGRTEETLDLEDDDFNWADFYREQWADVVTGESLDKFKTEYKESDEEKRDLLSSFEKHKGNMNAIYHTVMLSNPLEDEERFRHIIDEAIKSGEVEAYPKYTNESERSRETRMKNARREGVEARELAKELGIEDKLFGNGKGKKKGKGKGEDEDALAALIMQRQKGRSENFLERLEEKYAGGKAGSNGKTGKKRSKQEADEPPEEMFQQAAERSKKAKQGKKAQALADETAADAEGSGARRSKRTRK
ncbi:MAG: hypothetical protein M1819_005607 [Sarea resinae]|nr:MAG: hypothetical protein M1819_005607 [Sarea resinae]